MDINNPQDKCLVTQLLLAYATQRIHRTGGPDRNDANLGLGLSQQSWIDIQSILSSSITSLSLILKALI